MVDNGWQRGDRLGTVMLRDVAGRGGRRLDQLLALRLWQTGHIRHAFADGEAGHDRRRRVKLIRVISDIDHALERVELIRLVRCHLADDIGSLPDQPGSGDRQQRSNFADVREGLFSIFLHTAPQAAEELVSILGVERLGDGILQLVRVEFEPFRLEKIGIERIRFIGGMWEGGAFRLAQIVHQIGIERLAHRDLLC